MTRTLVSAALAAAILAAAPAVAAPREMQSPAYLVFVPTGDLDLASRADQHKLERRLRKAAREVCGDQSAPGVNEWRLVRNCRASFAAAAHPREEQSFAGRSARPVAVASR